MTTATEEGSLKANGFTIDKGLHDILKEYRLKDAKSDTVVPQGVLPEDHPMFDRQERIKPPIKSLEGIVKKHLDKDPRLNPEKDYKRAEAIVNELVYEFAKTKGYKSKLEDFKDEQVRDYLGQIFSATDNQIFRNKTALIRSILDLAFANPESDNYDKNSALAQLIGYIGVQKDEPDEKSGKLGSAKLNYMKQVLAEKWTMLGKDGRAIPNVFSAKTGIKLKPYATAAEAFGELERQGAYELQGLIQRLPKTYTATPQTQMDKAA